MLVSLQIIITELSHQALKEIISHVGFSGGVRVASDVQRALASQTAYKEFETEQ